MPILYDDFGSYAEAALSLDDSAIEIFLDPGEYFVADSHFNVNNGDVWMRQIKLPPRPGA